MDDIYKTAVLKARTVWLQNLLLELLPQLDDVRGDYHTWFNSLIEFMNGRGLVEPTQQKDYLSDVRNAIKVINPNHSALEVVDFDRETWVQINNRSSDRIAERKTKLIKDPNAIVERATILLNSYQWSEIAAGLAVVTGRRCTEVIKTAQFKYQTKYSVLFTGSLKRKGEAVKCVFEIPTLCEAQIVIKAISKLREYLGTEIEHLSKRQVSRRYGQAVASKCDRYFNELVPTREDRDNLYTHLFRAVYGTIASYWYCPITVPEIEFRAAIQGHYQIIEEQDPQLRRSIAAGRNYFDYKISDGSGNIDGRLGIKLHLPNVRVISQFQSSEDLRAPKDNLPTLKTIDNLAIPIKLEQDDSDRDKSAFIVSQQSKQKSSNIDRSNDEISMESTTSISSISNPNKLESSNSTYLINQSYSSKSMNESVNSSSNSAVSIPSFFLPRLNAISNKLEISERETIQALFTWTEMGLSLAEQLSVKEFTPQAIFEAVEELQSSKKESSTAIKDSAASLTTQGVEELTALDRDSINQLCTTVRLLSEALSVERLNSDVRNHSSHQIDSASRRLKKREDNNSSNKSDNSSKPKQVSKEEVLPSKQKQKTEPEQSINKAIDTIMEFNNDESRETKDKWHIGVGSLRKLTQRGDSVINRVIKSRKSEIEQHHELHGLGKWHNARGKDYPSIDEIINFNE